MVWAVSASNFVIETVISMTSVGGLVARAAAPKTNFVHFSDQVATLTTNASCLVTKDIVLAIDAKCSITKATILTTCVSGLVVSVTIPMVQSMAPLVELLILLIYLKNFTYHTNP